MQPLSARPVQVTFCSACQRGKPCWLFALTIYISHSQQQLPPSRSNLIACASTSYRPKVYAYHRSRSKIIEWYLQELGVEYATIPIAMDAKVCLTPFCHTHIAKSSQTTTDPLFTWAVLSYRSINQKISSRRLISMGNYQVRLWLVDGHVNIHPSIHTCLHTQVDR